MCLSDSNRPQDCFITNQPASVARTNARARVIVFWASLCSADLRRSASNASNSTPCTDDTRSPCLLSRVICFVGARARAGKIICEWTRRPLCDVLRVCAMSVLLLLHSVRHADIIYLLTHEHARACAPRHAAVAAPAALGTQKLSPSASSSSTFHTCTRSERVLFETYII